MKDDVTKKQILKLGTQNKMTTVGSGIQTQIATSRYSSVRLFATKVI
jgi:hypothetical protein